MFSRKLTSVCPASRTRDPHQNRLLIGLQCKLPRIGEYKMRTGQRQQLFYSYELASYKVFRLVFAVSSNLSNTHIVAHRCALRDSSTTILHTLISRLYSKDIFK
eukprot:1176976-Prorocentrum_minimum.AAC.3